MFTGIVKEVGSVLSLAKRDGSYRLDVVSLPVSKDAEVGGSVSVNGACLTVTAIDKMKLSFDVMEETLGRTTLAVLRPGDAVNLEGALRSGDPLGGHFVLGHVDCVADILKIRRDDNGYCIEISVPDAFSGLVVEKGSVAIDGVSLTVGKAGKNSCELYLIPHTLKTTNLGSKRRGDKVNIEFDILGKYVLRNTEYGIRNTKVTESFLRDKGFG